MTKYIGSAYQVTSPTLSDNASIEEAFEYYHQGGTSGSPLPYSVEQHLININAVATNIQLATGYTFTGTNSSTFSPTSSINSRLNNLEASIGTSLGATYVKITPTSNTSGSSSNIITAGSATIIPLIITGATNQSADLQEWKPSTAVAAKVDSSGKIYSYSTKDSAPAQVVTVSDTQTLTNKTLNSPIQTIGTNAQVASYTLTATDQSKVVEVNSASSTTVTIPDESSTTIFPIGAYIVVLQTGVGQIVIAGQNFTPNSTPGLKLRTQWSMATLIKRGTNSWVVAGDLVA